MMVRTLRFLSGVGALTIVAGCQSSAPTTGLEVLARSRAAIAQIEHVSYRGEYGATGWLETRVPAVTGEVVLGPKSKWDLVRYRCDVAIQRGGSEETRRFVSGSDGNVFYLIDPATRTAHEDMDPAVLGSNGRDIQRVLMSELVSGDPYGKELSADAVELVGSGRVAGGDCFEVRIKSDSPPHVAWMIGKKDFMPRRITRTYPNRNDPAGPPGTTHLTVIDLVADPKLERDPFVLSVPPGYTRTDEFAP